MAGLGPGWGPWAPGPESLELPHGLRGGSGILLEETEWTLYQSGLGAPPGPSGSGLTCFPWGQEEWDNMK